MAECTGLENRRPRKGPVGSNPTPSAVVLSQDMETPEPSGLGGFCVFGGLAVQVGLPRGCPHPGT